MAVFAGNGDVSTSEGCAEFLNGANVISPDVPPAAEAGGRSCFVVRDFSGSMNSRQWIS
jgi:hypothetical protein